MTHHENTVLFLDERGAMLSRFDEELQEKKFNLLKAHSIDESIDILESHSEIDVVICGAKINSTSGFDYLNKVRERFPDKDRLIISNDTDESAIARAVTKGIISAFIIEPIEDGILNETLGNLLEVRSNLQNKILLSKLNRIEKLPTLPKIYNMLMKAINDDKPIKEIARIIENDVSITTKVLQIANSAFYGFRATTSLVRAMMVIGLNILRDIVLTFAITDQMDWTSDQATMLEEVSAHSLIANRLNGEIFQMNYFVPLPPTYSSVGITHDIGKIILIQYFPEQFKKIIDLGKEKSELDFYELELELGYEGQTHSEIGAYFLKNWNLPNTNSQVALYHHTPERCGQRKVDMMRVFKFSDKVADEIWKQRRSSSVDLSHLPFDDADDPKINELATRVRDEFRDQF